MKRHPLPRMHLALLLFAMVMFGLSLAFLSAGSPAELRVSNLCLGIGIGVNLSVAVLRAADSKPG